MHLDAPISSDDVCKQLNAIKNLLWESNNSKLYNFYIYRVLHYRIFFSSSTYNVNIKRSEKFYDHGCNPSS